MEKQASKKKILVVEDDFGARTIAKTILVSAGYEVSEAVNGQEALEVVETETFDAFVVDLMMPVMSGYDFVVHIKQRVETQNTPVIMLTAKGDDEDIIAGYRDFACDYYITKPFTSAQLIQGVRLVLDELGQEQTSGSKTNSPSEPS